MAALNGQIPPGDHVYGWFSSRSYDDRRFSDIDFLARRKHELGVSVSVVLPCREVAVTIGAVADEIHALNERRPLVDEVLAIVERTSRRLVEEIGLVR
jgi:hypothetical protein